MWPAAPSIVAAIGNIADEARLSREADEARENRDATHMPWWSQDPLLERLLCFCGVEHAVDLPPIHAALVNSSAIHIRRTLQGRLEAGMERLGYGDSAFPVSQKLAWKLADMNFRSWDLDDFGSGIGPFSLGPYNRDAMEVVRQHAAVTDALLDVQWVVSLEEFGAVFANEKDIGIPRSMCELRCCVRRLHAVVDLMLGPDHQWCREFAELEQSLRIRETAFMQAVPQNQSHLHIVPALLARRIQVLFNLWWKEQAFKVERVRVPQLSQMLKRIEEHADWAPNFPAKYLGAANNTGIDGLGMGIDGFGMDIERTGDGTYTIIYQQNITFASTNASDGSSCGSGMDNNTGSTGSSNHNSNSRNYHNNHRRGKRNSNCQSISCSNNNDNDNCSGREGSKTHTGSGYINNNSNNRSNNQNYNTNQNYSTNHGRGKHNSNNRGNRNSNNPQSYNTNHSNNNKRAVDGKVDVAARSVPSSESE